MIAERLQEIFRIKKDIKDALEDRGFENVTDIFATYADLIRQLPKYILGKWVYSNFWKRDRRWTYNK